LADLNADARSEAYNGRQKRAIEREFFKKRELALDGIELVRQVSRERG
jgi:hypothetical protein